MELRKEIENEAESILSKLSASGLSLIVTGQSTLRVKGEATPTQLEICRKWKTHLINQLSPKCSNCTLQMQLINGGTLWFCPFGCQSRKVR